MRKVTWSSGADRQGKGAYSLKGHWNMVPMTGCFCDM